MNIPCVNSIAADQHAYEEGKKSEQEERLKSVRKDVESQLNDGDAVSLGKYTMTKAEIIGEGLTPDDCQLIADLHTLGPAMMLSTTNQLIKRCDEIMEAWLDKHISIIADIREKADAEYAAEMRAERLNDAA